MLSNTVFISYSRKDSSFVLKLAERLRETDIALWIDQYNIPIGDYWDNNVVQGIKDSKSILFILSPASVKSPNALNELDLATELEKNIIPVLIQPCERPLDLRRRQYVDFTVDYEAGFSQLTRALKKELNTLTDTDNSSNEIQHQGAIPLVKAPATKNSTFNSLVPVVDTLSSELKINSKKYILLGVLTVVICSSVLIIFYGTSRQGNKNNLDKITDLKRTNEFKRAAPVTNRKNKVNNIKNDSIPIFRQFNKAQSTVKNTKTDKQLNEKYSITPKDNKSRSVELVTYTFKGYVKDSITKAGIKGIKIKIGDSIVTTNESGNYQVKVSFPYSSNFTDINYFKDNKNYRKEIQINPSNLTYFFSFEL